MRYEVAILCICVSCGTGTPQSGDAGSGSQQPPVGDATPAGGDSPALPDSGGVAPPTPQRMYRVVELGTLPGGAWANSMSISPNGTFVVGVASSATSSQSSFL